MTKTHNSKSSDCLSSATFEPTISKAERNYVYKSHVRREQKRREAENGVD